MSPTSYLAAPPRGVRRILTMLRRPSTRTHELAQPLGVTGREDLPVVVEVGEDLRRLAQLADTGGPLPELAVGVVAAMSAAAIVEAQVRPVRGEDLRRRSAPARVVDDEGDAVLA